MARKFTKRTPRTNYQKALPTDCTALYIRVSTQKQAEEGFSLDAQRQRLTAMCTANGWRLCDDQVYTDAGESGKSADRQAYQAMLTAIEAGAINRVVVAKLDRLSRNTRDFLEFLDFCDRHDCAIVSIAEGFDTGTPTGRAVVTVLMAFAELERTQIKDRVMTGKREKARRGGYNGAFVPLGYCYNGAWSIDEAAAAAVRTCFDRYNAGDTLTAIAQELNASAAPTARGGKWHPATVRYILTNGFYAGLNQWDGADAVGEWPAIIDLEAYQAAQQRLDAPGRTTPGAAVG